MKRRKVIAACLNYKVNQSQFNDFLCKRDSVLKKSIGLQLNYRLSDNLELNYSNYLGNESTIRGQKKIRFYNDFYARYDIQDDWHVVVQLDYGTQEQLTSEDQGHIFAIMGLTQYRISDRLHVAARLEHFNDSKKILVSTETPNGFKNTNVAMSFDYIPVPYVKCRLEGRSFFSQDEIYNAGEMNEKNDFVLVGSIAVDLDRNAFKKSLHRSLHHKYHPAWAAVDGTNPISPYIFLCNGSARYTVLPAGKCVYRLLPGFVLHDRKCYNRH